MTRHSDADILQVTLCGYCKLPLCPHNNCLNVGECVKADATRCRCYVIYSYDYDHGQELIGDSRCNGKHRRQRRSTAA